MDSSLRRAGGGLVAIEQFAVPMNTVGEYGGPDMNEYIFPAGGSEGYGVGATIGVKLAAPDKPVVGLVGDGSLYYADSGLWTAAHHRVPVLYVISNNGAYGIVADSFERGARTMSETGEYAGVVLGGIDPVKIAEAFGVEGLRVDDESRLEDAIAHGLRVNDTEARPFLSRRQAPAGPPRRRPSGDTVPTRLGQGRRKGGITRPPTPEREAAAESDAAIEWNQARGDQREFHGPDTSG